MNEQLKSAIEKLCSELQDAHHADLRARGMEILADRVPTYDPVTYKERRKFTTIDIGTSGAFLVENETGELYNIKGYGVPDYNKKKKADIGNIFQVDAEILLQKRWNYLR